MFGVVVEAGATGYGGALDKPLATVPLPLQRVHESIMNAGFAII
jgi:hypothetical protein